MLHHFSITESRYQQDCLNI